MVTVPEFADCIMLPLLTCLEDGSSPPEDKTDAYLRLAEDLAKEDKQFVQEVCKCSTRLFFVLTRDMISKRIDLSQAALQAVGYCLYQEQVVSSLQEHEMSMIIQDLCNLIVNSSDKNLCTRALWGLGKQHLSTVVIENKLPVILKTVEYALVSFASPTVEKEALEVIYRLLSQLPNEIITSTAGQWSKLVYPLLISSAHKIREKALGILELGLNPILSAREEVVASLLPDLKGGLLSNLTKCFADKKEVFVLRAWIILVTILGEALHKNGSLINDMLKIPEQGFKSSLPNVQSMSYSAWISLIDNFAISPAFIGSLKKIKLLMMPILLSSGKVIHKDIEFARLQAWWHLVCTIKTNYTGPVFAEVSPTWTAKKFIKMKFWSDKIYCNFAQGESQYYEYVEFPQVCIPLLQYFFNVNIESGTTPHGRPRGKDGMQELALPVTPIAYASTSSLASPSPAPVKSSKSGSRRKSAVFNKEKFPDDFVKQVMLLGCDMLSEILAVDEVAIKKSKRLTEHLELPILHSSYFRENKLFFLAVVKFALCSYAKQLEDSLALSIWTNLVNRVVFLLHNENDCRQGDSEDIDDVMAPLFLAAQDMTCEVLGPTLVLKFLDVLAKLPPKYLLYPFAIFSSVCFQGKPIFLLADILFNQLSSFKGSYVDKRFHIVFEGLIDIGLQAPSGKLSNVYNVWLSLEGLASTIANVEDLWRFWSKVTDSVSDCVTKTSDVNQGDRLEHDFSLMISLLTFPFKQVFAGGLPGATAKELDRDLAEFFQLFFRCASVVPTVEPNSCVEELSNRLLTVVSQEKCKNTRFLDGICNLINVMMDCVDFTAQNITPTPSTRGSVTPAIKTKPTGEPLDNLSSLVFLSAKVLGIAYEVDKNSSGLNLVAPAVTVLAGTLSKLFAQLTIPQHIKVAIGALANPLTLFFSHCQSSLLVLIENRFSDKKFSNAKFLLKIEKLWTDILMCLQSRYTAAFDSDLLATMTELLESTFCHPRRQLRNQTIMFWNATFAHADYLDYPTSLRPCLRTVLEKTPLTLPGWKKSEVPPFDFPATLQDSEEMTPKENIIKPQVVIANSPKRKHGSSSPGKLKGSFLHKAFSSDKTDRLSPFKNNLESSASKRKSPAGTNVRRKLPLLVDSGDDKDFVVIAPSPKKKRFLTEHQKEVRKAKKLGSDHPVLYNMLDQSQDGMQFSEWSQSLSQSLSQNLKDIEEAVSVQMDDVIGQQIDKNPDKEMDSFPKVTDQSFIAPQDDNANKVNELGKSLDMNPDGENTMGKTNADEFEVRDGDRTICSDNCDVNTSVDQDELSPEFIPSSQTPQSFPLRENQNGRAHVPFQSLVIAERLPGFCTCSECDTKCNAVANPEPVETGEAQAKDGKKARLNALATTESPMDEGVRSTGIVLTKTSPVSSRTRLKRKPTNSFCGTPKAKTKSVAKPIPLSSDVEGEVNHVAEAVDPPMIRNEESECSDHELDDTQILSPVENGENSVASIAVGDDKGPVSSDQTAKENETTSSPVTGSSSKFPFSKNVFVGSPSQRSTRTFSSPAASPTTGILKRSKGNVDTPSPPGKTRHVSFAYPLREEKEISIESIEEDMLTEEAKPVEITNDFTNIKSTPTRSPAGAISPGDCVFPDLVECSTPVEQILPSLATSRWSRGLGHLVHAQNIRTVGNLSALTEDQVEKLPIRSPKVSTLRRVLRNFHETHASKSPKVCQREIREIVEEQEQKADDKSVVEEDTNDFTAESGANNDFTPNKDTSNAPGNLGATPRNDCRDLGGSEGDPNLVNNSSVASESVLDLDSDKMLTPKRSRFQARPTTLFETETDKMEIQTEVTNADGEKPLADNLPDDCLLPADEDESSCLPDHCDIGPDVSKDGDEISKEVCGESSSESDENREMIVETTAPTKYTVDPFVVAVGNLISLKTEEELAGLPFDTLFTCHEQLTTILSNIMSAIKSKCE